MNFAYGEAYTKNNYVIMDIIRELTGGNVFIYKDSQYNTLAAENVTVAEGITARFFGTIYKDLILKHGSKVYLHGEIGGKVINEGGEFFKYGN